jgi:hypothetical protein
LDVKLEMDAERIAKPFVSVAEFADNPYGPERKGGVPHGPWLLPGRRPCLFSSFRNCATLTRCTGTVAPTPHWSMIA